MRTTSNWKKSYFQNLRFLIFLVISFADCYYVVCYFLKQHSIYIDGQHSTIRRPIYVSNASSLDTNTRFHNHSLNRFRPPPRKRRPRKKKKLVFANCNLTNHKMLGFISEQNDTKKEHVRTWIWICLYIYMFILYRIYVYRIGKSRMDYLRECMISYEYLSTIYINTFTAPHIDSRKIQQQQKTYLAVTFSKENNDEVFFISN